MIDGPTRERLIAEDLRSAEVIQPLIGGEEVRRYYIDSQGAWLLYLTSGTDLDGYPAIRQHLQPFRKPLEKRAGNQAWYELQQPQEAYRDFFDGPKIVYPDIGVRPRFAFDSGPLYPKNTCFFIPGENWFLVGLLNSRTTWFYLRHISALLESKTEGEPHADIRFFKQYMERLPVPSASETEARELADLARRMTDLQSEMRRERAEFLAWLEGEIGCPVDDLTNKTRVQGYDVHPADALLGVLEQNHRRRVMLDVTAPREYGASNPHRERIRRAHATSTERLAPLAREFAAADARADEIVYGLFGLTPEEMKIVEAGR
jgi:hypothetical protein